MLYMKTFARYETGCSTMPNRRSVLQSKFREENGEANISRSVTQENIHLPEITETSTNVKHDKKTGKFSSFPNEGQSFTENLISFFTGNRDRISNRPPSRPTVPKKPAPPVKHDENSKAGDGPKTSKHRSNPSFDSRNGKPASHKQNGRHAPEQRYKHASLKRTDHKKITATVKDEAFRPVTSNSTKPTENDKAAETQDESDTGGYETMYKTKQPAGRAGKPRKRSVELSEYLRKENYRYNERIAKQYLFQKWLKSTEREFPEEISERKR